MATKNPWLTRVKLCEKQIRCDGEQISPRKKDQSMCGKCEQATAQRAKKSRPLKGSKLYPEDVDV